ncbi:hypothetical protein EUGRSUZ_C01457 [Eucalyptus grandis]|uniref:Uncharacterized protein n=2 Tax=Eucalyptus grandis TaxID=71139 RepID=A0ACC3LDA2_EUCGR|nr:hypothetical protein EUGRSUZ_C01457 [Eucalyptus grandis]
MERALPAVASPRRRRHHCNHLRCTDRPACLPAVDARWERWLQSSGLGNQWGDWLVEREREREIPWTSSRPSLLPPVALNVC